MQDQQWFEQLGELTMTEYYRVLSALIGVDFAVRWDSLNYCEQQAWIEAAKTAATVSAQYKKANEEFSMRSS